MKFNKNYFEEYKDIFNHYKNIQQINMGYRLYFNKKNHTLAIVNIFNNYEICYSFEHISQINLDILRFYRIENYQNILNKIDSDNNILNQTSVNKKRDLIQYTLKNILTLQNRSKSTQEININKIIGATKC